MGMLMAHPPRQAGPRHAPTHKHPTRTGKKGPPAKLTGPHERLRLERPIQDRCIRTDMRGQPKNLVKVFEKGGLLSHRKALPGRAEIHSRRNEISRRKSKSKEFAEFSGRLDHTCPTLDLHSTGAQPSRRCE